jgi:hypothetical protein
MNMTKIIIVLLTSLCSYVSAFETAGDSIYVGRKCNIVLHNTFQTDGEIISVGADSIVFKGEFGVYTIPRSQIKTVNNWDIEEEETGEIVQIADTSEYCDVYCEKGVKLTDVKLVKESDSTILILKYRKIKSYPVSSIRRIVFRHSGFLTGSMIGLGAGTAVSALIFMAYSGDLFLSVFYGALVSIPVGVIGGIIGAIIANDEVYEFEKGSPPAKVKKINYIIGKHKQ